MKERYGNLLTIQQCERRSRCRYRRLIGLLFLAWIWSACSIDVTGEPTPAPPAGADAAPQDTESDNAAPAVEVSPVEASSCGDLGLSGQLYFVGFLDAQQALLKLDLETGEETIVFDPPENAWLNEAALSPDGRQIIMSYAPPPGEGQVQFGFTDLYTMPADGSQEPALLRQRTEASETFFNVSWPAEDYIYFAHVSPSVDDLGAVLYLSQVERMRLSDGEIEVLVRTAAWPRVSRDGTRLALVTESNQFMVAEPDGTNANPILDPEAFPAVDAPFFSPDNSWIYFSAAADTAPQQSFWDRLLGVRVASAHSVPSDWWRLPADGSGEPQRLTSIGAIGLYGDSSADGQHIAFSASEGIFVMNPDGSGVCQLRQIPTIGIIDWVS